MRSQARPATIVLAAPLAWLVSYAGCGGEVGENRPPPNHSDAATDSAKDVVAEMNDAPGEADAPGDTDASVCAHDQYCSDVGATCTNGCGEPCVCTDQGFAIWWRCPFPVAGAPCDVATTPGCEYTPDTNSDIISCQCQAPEGEYFWICFGGVVPESVCPKEPPVTGTSCAGIVPAGVICNYSLEGGFSQGCACHAAGGQKLWSCNPP